VSLSHVTFVTSASHSLTPADYRWLEEVNRVDDNAKRHRPPTPRRELPQHLGSLVHQARLRGVRLLIMPPGMPHPSPWMCQASSMQGPRPCGTCRCTCRTQPAWPGVLMARGAGVNAKQATGFAKRGQISSSSSASNTQVTYGSSCMVPLASVTAISGASQ
jgi:hypothetical protein